MAIRGRVQTLGWQHGQRGAVAARGAEFKRSMPGGAAEEGGRRRREKQRKKESERKREKEEEDTKVVGATIGWRYQQEESQAMGVSAFPSHASEQGLPFQGKPTMLPSLLPVSCCLQPPCDISASAAPSPSSLSSALLLKWSGPYRFGFSPSFAATSFGTLIAGMPVT